MLLELFVRCGIPLFVDGALNLLLLPLLFLPLLLPLLFLDETIFLVFLVLFFAFNDNNLQCVGSTFMYIDEGIDTGEIIHQVRAKMYHGDTFHQICTRLIIDSIEALKILIIKYKKIKRKKSKKSAFKKYYYKRSDFQKVSLKSFYKKFDQNLSNYLLKKDKINKKNKIIQQPFIK